MSVDVTKSSNNSESNTITNIDTTLCQPPSYSITNNSQYFNAVISRNKQEQIIEDILLAHKVIQSGIPNRYGCRIRVRSNWSLEFLDQWLLDYEDREILEWIKYGFSISREDSYPDPVPANCNHKGATQFPQAITDYIRKEIALDSTIGPFRIPPFINRIGISPLSSREKKNSPERRVILDLSYPEGKSVNSGIDKRFYCGNEIDLKYPTIDTLARRVADIGPNALMWKRDLKRFFRQLNLCPRDYSLIGYRWNNLLFFDTSIPMGLTSAAYCAQRISNCIVFIHNSIGYWSINYLDDFGSAEYPENAVSSYNAMGKILSSAGVQEATEKAVPPTTRMEFLGNTLDSEKMTIEVSPDRKEELLELLDDWKSRQYFTKKQLQSLIGKLSFVTNCVRPGRIFLSRLIYRLTDCATSGNKLDQEMVKDIQWWRDYLPDFDGVSILWLEDCLTTNAWLASDASLIGGGAVHKKQFFHVKFSPFIMNTTTNIAQRELYTILIAVKLWAKELSGKVVRFSTDSQVAMFAVNRGRTHDPFMLACLRELTRVLANHQILLKAVYLNTKLNTLPDALSRWYINSEARRIVRRITKNRWSRRSVAEDIHIFHEQSW